MKINWKKVALIAEQAGWAAAWVVLGYIQVDQLNLNPAVAVVITFALADAKNYVGTKVGNKNSTSFLPATVDPASQSTPPQL